MNGYWPISLEWRKEDGIYFHVTIFVIILDQLNILNLNIIKRKEEIELIMFGPNIFFLKRIHVKEKIKKVNSVN